MGNWRNKPKSIETKRKISLAHIGMKKPWVSPIHKGKVLSSETRKKISDAVKAHGGSMENNPNWRGGISYKVACRIVFERDDYTCQICGLRDPDVMEIDHRLTRKLHPALAQELSNLWVLCANCHRRKTKRDWRDITAARAK